MADNAHHRLAERQKLKRLLLAGRNVLMLAPRRIGKTWLMKQLEGDVLEDGYNCIRIDVEGVRTENDFLRILCQEIDGKQEVTESVTAFLKAKLNQIKCGTSGETITQMIGSMDPRVFSETLIGALNRREGRTLVLIDEFSLFIWEQARQNADATRTLLYHLRRLQQEFTNVSWLLTGSVGLDVVARRFNLEGAFLDFEVFPLDPFTEEEARSFLAEQFDRNLIGERFDFGEGAFACLVRELGWLSPYYLSHVARCVRATDRPDPDGTAVATEADILQAFDTLLSPRHQTYFAPWREHIQKNFLADETDRLRAILAKCCERTDGEREDTLLGHIASSFPGFSRRNLKDLLMSLGSDGYLVKDRERWRFRSGLLRRYWLDYVA